MKRAILSALMVLCLMLISGHLYAADFYVIPVKSKASNIVWKGEWSDSTAYSVNDAVGYEGSSYVASAPSQTEPHRI